MRVASGIFGVAVTAFLVALCPDTLCMLHQDRQMTATPVCPPDNGTIILLPKPENCSEFYQCSGGYAFTQHCPPNLYYCEEKELCSWISDPNCSYNCVRTKTNPVPAADVYIDCPIPNEDPILYPDPNNCSQYIQCHNGVAETMSCPSGLYFCDQLDICSWVWDPECKYDCIVTKTIPIPVEEKFDVIHERDETTTSDPRCVQIGDDPIFLPNPDDCNWYYECSNGIPVPLECPDDLYFCTQVNACAWIWEPGCVYDCIVKPK